MCLGVLILKQDEMGTAREFQSLISRQNEPNNPRKLLEADSTPLATIFEWFLVQAETRRHENTDSDSQHFLELWEEISSEFRSAVLYSFQPPKVQRLLHQS